MFPIDPATFDDTLAFAEGLDRRDPLARFRDRFSFPRNDAEHTLYFCGNSLGLLPLDTPAAMQQELDDWARFGVEGHFKAKNPWYSYAEQLAEPLARLVGARPVEVAAMNSLTVNLHLMLVSFFRPEGRRRKILIEDSAFPSDRYAFQSQLAFHGLDPHADLLVARPREGEHTLRTEDFVEQIEKHGDEIALVLPGGVNFTTGQFFDIPALCAAAHAQGCAFGVDLAHAAGNLPLQLHDWDVDFAVWCSYKYLNAGPGSAAGCFVHERHADSPERPRFAGWWGNDPDTRFAMEPTFQPNRGAAGWQLSNPSVFALAPLRSSLALFDEATMPALRDKSISLTAYLEFLLERLPVPRFETMTPRDPAQRGCQLSLRMLDAGPELVDSLQRRGVTCDFRPPNVLRVAPVPLYNSFSDVWRFVSLVREV